LCGQPCSWVPFPPFALRNHFTTLEAPQILKPQFGCAYTSLPRFCSTSSAADATICRICFCLQNFLVGYSTAKGYPRISFCKKLINELV
jgi:hypothetical protein